MPFYNFTIGSCYGIAVAGQTMGSYTVYNGRVVAETVNSVTIRYMGRNQQVRRRTIRRTDIMKVAKL